ncbi:MAG: alcohol dehydrogenase [Lasallia pustulata]|uniref:Alcohol dehydrogenase n=1 Tax=Lasallia pustulata TaxID=136370 RepID=A0A1W5D0Z9_9LECA|nr:MAG: alcohol dehydrogenase [Lasallia pustulata]SLM36652.1 alcohol dehydrogenase [Lasallia pustulata]
MAVSQAANLLEKAMGHTDTATTEQDVTNPARERAKYADPSGETMKALCWMGKDDVQVLETPKPGLIEDRDVILKVTGSTVCGSDLHLLHGAVVQMQKGDILGHEFCGKVESMGPAVKGLKPGDRVVASFQIACGECMYCKQKLSSQCERTNSNKTEDMMYGGRTAGMFGYSHFTGGFAGGQAEYVRVPYGDVNLLKIPDNVPDEKALYLSDVLATSWNCVVDTGVKEGDVVAIWGAGPIGQMAAHFSFMNGASRVILIDGGAASWRLDFCKSKLPKLETINFTSLPKGHTVTSLLKEMNHGGPDVALECVAGEYAKSWAHKFELLMGMETDTSEIVNEMITSVKSFGRCGITGVYVGFTNHFNIGALMERGIRLIGNGQAPVHMYWEKLLEMIQTKEIDPLVMVSHRVLMEELDIVYKKFEAREDNMQKVFVQTKFSDPPCPGAPQVKSYL